MMHVLDRRDIKPPEITYRETSLMNPKDFIEFHDWHAVAEASDLTQVSADCLEVVIKDDSAWAGDADPAKPIDSASQRNDPATIFNVKIPPKLLADVRASGPAGSGGRDAGGMEEFHLAQRESDSGGHHAPDRRLGSD